MATAAAVSIPSISDAPPHEVAAAKLEFAAARYARILNGPEPLLPRDVFDVLNGVKRADRTYRAITGLPLFDEIPSQQEVLANRRIMYREMQVRQ